MSLIALLDRAGIQALIPHAGTMSLWDELLAADESSVLVRTLSHRRADHPLRREGRLAALHLVEYGAQAMAVHGGWSARRASGGGSAKPCVLAAVRDFKLAVETLDTLTGAIQCRAHRLLANAGGWMYEFELSCDGAPLASGRASVIHAAG